MSRSDREREHQRIRRADPAKVIATELAFARAAQEKGQWTAFAEFAADDAVMFVPQPVNAEGMAEEAAEPAAGGALAAAPGCGRAATVPSR